MTSNAEVKKRRAPPPPVATPALQNVDMSGQAKTAAQVTVTPKNGLLCLLPSVHSSELKSFTNILGSHQLQLAYTLHLRKWNYWKCWSFVHIYLAFLRLPWGFSHTKNLFKSEKVCEALCLKKVVEWRSKTEKVEMYRVIRYPDRLGQWLTSGEMSNDWQKSSVHYRAQIVVRLLPTSVFLVLLWDAR